MKTAKIVANVVDVESPWLTHEALKHYLGDVSDEWVRKHIWADRFVEVKKVGKKLFYLKAQVDRLIMRHKFL